MKRKLKIMNHQIDQLKEEITTKEAALVKVNLDHTRVEKEKEALKVGTLIFMVCWGAVELLYPLMKVV